MSFVQSGPYTKGGDLVPLAQGRGSSRGLIPAVFSPKKKKNTKIQIGRFTQRKKRDQQASSCTHFLSVPT